VAIFLRVSRRLYVWLLVLYPARLRSSFGAEMADVFAEQLSGAWKLERFQVSPASGPRPLKSWFWLRCRHS
jgi:hypothetical protein